MKKFLRTEKTKIIGGGNKPVILKGVNLGGWLMMEGYILHAPNSPVQRFKKHFAQTLGASALRVFEKDFYDNFMREDDIAAIAKIGFNCIRVPFNYRLVEKNPYRYDPKGLYYLDRTIRWAQKYGIWVILDLHAAPGAQNHDWHSDSLGEADLWKRKDCQERTFALWEFLADRYKDNRSVAGYDLLNESVIDNARLLNSFYKYLIKRLRAIDKNHIFFVEGNQWAMDLECLDRFDDENLALSIHAYRPLDFTFNLIPHLSYPLEHQGQMWHKDKLYKILSAYEKISKKRQVPIFVGEFGVNDRQGRYGEDRWLKDMLACFKDFGFHWAYWTYKAVKNNVFPDGIFSYRDNPAWVNRQGPKTGWDTYTACWPKKRKEMVRSWQTSCFGKNTPIFEILKNAARQ